MGAVLVVDIWLAGCAVTVTVLTAEAAVSCCCCWLTGAARRDFPAATPPVSTVGDVVTWGRAQNLFYSVS
jgi:hypothetical protein